MTLSVLSLVPAGDPTGIFSGMPESGQLVVNRDYLSNLSVTLNFESKTTFFNFTVTGGRYGFDSGWSYMRSLAPSPSTTPFLEHALRNRGTD